MNPRVSLVLFSKVFTFFKTNGEFLHGVHDHFSTSAFFAIGSNGQSAQFFCESFIVGCVGEYKEDGEDPNLNHVLRIIINL